MSKALRALLIGTDIHPGQGVIKGIQGYCSSHGNWELHFERDAHFDLAKRVRDAVHVWKAAGIIAHIRHQRSLKMVRDAGLPTVNISASFDTGFPSVLPDNEAAGRIAARYFMDNGFRNFAFIARTPEGFALRRCAGFQEELAKHGLTCEVFEDVFRGHRDDWVENRRMLARRLVALKKPVAILCVYDSRSQDVALQCRQLGLSVPGEVAIASMGNDESICLTTTPPTSSVETAFDRLGYEAAKMLHQMLRKGGAWGRGKESPRTVLIPPRQMVVRQSSDMIAVEDADVAEAMRFIRLNAQEPISVKHVLRAVPLSRKTLERRFESLVGRTPAAEIARVRLERGQQLLSGTNLTIPEVARKSGFVSHATFSTFFRTKTGMTPTRYRRESR